MPVRAFSARPWPGTYDLTTARSVPIDISERGIAAGSLLFPAYARGQCSRKRSWRIDFPARFVGGVALPHTAVPSRVFLPFLAPPDIPNFDFVPPSLYTVSKVPFEMVAVSNSRPAFSQVGLLPPDCA